MFAVPIALGIAKNNTTTKKNYTNGGILQTENLLAHLHLKLTAVSRLEDD